MITMPVPPFFAPIETDDFVANLLRFPTEPIPQPRRYQRKKTKNYHLPRGVVCVCRPNRWSNPFDTAKEFKNAFETILYGKHKRGLPFRPAIYDHIATIIDDIYELRGKDLACWCDLNKSCHADYLIEFANR